MHTPLFGGVDWSCKGSLTWGATALLTGVGEPNVLMLTPIGEVRGVIWLILPVSSVRLHGSSRSSSIWMSRLVDGLSASRTLSNLDVGRLILVRRELTLSEQGDWEGCVDLHAGFGAIAVLVGFSLAIVVRVVVPMVERTCGRLTLMKVSGMMMRSKIIIIIPPTVRLLVFFTPWSLSHCGSAYAPA